MKRPASHDAHVAVNTRPKSFHRDHADRILDLQKKKELFTSRVFGCLPGIDVAATSSEKLFGTGAPPTTKNTIEKDNAEGTALIVRELNELSLKERELMFDAIHGVAGDQQEESLKFLESKLDKLQVSLQSIDKKPAYNQAQFCKAEAVQCRELRLAMLRSCDYHPVQAARRLVQFFELKRELFGYDKLVKHPITQDDLTDDMRQHLREGKTQPSTLRDRAGRTVIYIRMDRNLTCWKALLGFNWYLYWNALMQNPEAQRKGFVVVIHNCMKERIDGKTFQVLKNTSRFNEAFPIKIAAVHYCHHSPNRPHMISHLYNSLTRALRLRVRVHNGTFMENVYHLMGYGITLDMLPSDLLGNLNVAHWHQRLDKLQRAERETVAKESGNDEIIPTSRDVVLGRGRTFQDFVGNVYLGQLIELNRAQYEEAPRLRKTRLARDIVHVITSVRGGRFLRREKDLWVKVSAEDARRKTSHGFRAPVRKELVVADGGLDMPIYTNENGEKVLVPP